MSVPKLLRMIFKMCDVHAKKLPDISLTASFGKTSEERFYQVDFQSFAGLDAEHGMGDAGVTNVNGGGFPNSFADICLKGGKEADEVQG